MRSGVCLAVLALAIVGCREAGDVPEAPKGPAPAPAITPSLVIGCMAPFTPLTTRADLAAAFGEGNVTQETVDGPEGIKVNVTAIYPGVARRRAEVSFSDEARGTGLTGVTVDRKPIFRGERGTSATVSGFDTGAERLKFHHRASVTTPQR